MPMFGLQPSPIDVIQINEKCIIDLFIKHNDLLMFFLQKGGLFTRDHLMELNRFGLDKTFVCGREAGAFGAYVSIYPDRDPYRPNSFFPR